MNILNKITSVFKNKETHEITSSNKIENNKSENKKFEVLLDSVFIEDYFGELKDVQNKENFEKWLKKFVEEKYRLKMTEFFSDLFRIIVADKGVHLLNEIYGSYEKALDYISDQIVDLFDEKTAIFLYDNFVNNFERYESFYDYNVTHVFCHKMQEKFDPNYNKMNFWVFLFNEKDYLYSLIVLKEKMLKSTSNLEDLPELKGVSMILENLEKLDNLDNKNIKDINLIIKRKDVFCYQFLSLLPIKALSVLNKSGKALLNLTSYIVFQKGFNLYKNYSDSENYPDKNNIIGKWKQEVRIYMERKNAFGETEEFRDHVKKTLTRIVAAKQVLDAIGVSKYPEKMKDFGHYVYMTMNIDYSVLNQDDFLFIEELTDLIKSEDSKSAIKKMKYHRKFFLENCLLIKC